MVDAQRNVSLSLLAGDRVALIGASGAGKSEGEVNSVIDAYSSKVAP